MDSTELSDPDLETIIATTTYINLPGTHTTETEVGRQDTEASSPSTSKQPGKVIQFHISETHDEVAKHQSTSPTSTAASHINITSLESPALETKPIVEPPYPAIPEIRTSIYPPDHENARESACCKVRTIIMDQNSNDSIAMNLEPQVVPASRRLNIVCSFCRELIATFAVCMQMNKDCIFCLLFFAGFMVTASFLTSFFYRAMTIDPQVFQYPTARGTVYYV